MTAKDRFTISLDDDLAAAFDELIKQHGYTTRSEAVRDLLREHLQKRAASGNAHGYCVANLSYVYDHHERELAERLASIQHAHHDLVLAGTQAPLDHQQRLESVLLKGSVRAMQDFVHEIFAERGVRHGRVNVVVDLGKPHRHRGATHRHLKPRD